MKARKLLTLILSVVMILTFSVTAFAAELTEAEKAFLAEVKAGYGVGTNKTFSVPASYVNALENYLATNDVTADEIKKIESSIDSAVAVIKEAGVTSIDGLTASQKEKVLGYASDAAAVKNLKVALDTKGNVAVTNAAGATIFNEKATGTIAKTGFGLEVTAAVGALIVVALVSCAVVSKRRTVEA